jgi:hypothetical protein
VSGSELAAVAALAAVCGLWVLLQRWIERSDPGNPGVKRECDGGCGSCAGGDRQGRCENP